MGGVCSRASYPFQCVLVGCGPRSTLGSHSNWGRTWETASPLALPCAWERSTVRASGVPSWSTFTGGVQEKEKGVLFRQVPKAEGVRGTLQLLPQFVKEPGWSSLCPLGPSLNFWKVNPSEQQHHHHLLCFSFQASDYKGALQGDPVWTQSTGKRCKFLFST